MNLSEKLLNSLSEASSEAMVYIYNKPGKKDLSAKMSVPEFLSTFKLSRSVPVQTAIDDYNKATSRYAELVILKNGKPLF